MMKRTSYIIIGLIIACAVSLIALTHYKIKHLLPPEVEPALCIIPLDTDEPIEELEFSSKYHSLYKDFLFGSISIELSDSVERPYFTIDSLFREYIDIKIRDNRLKLDIVSDPTTEQMKKFEKLLLLSWKYDNVISLVIPRQPIARITSTFGRLEINGLDTKKLTMFSNDHLDLNDCHIDSLLLTAGGYAKMKFKDSDIDYMRLSMEDNFIKINCCDSTTLIRKLDFIAREGIKTDVFLNEANIDTLRWDPPHPTQLTVRIKHPINIVK